MYLEIFQLTFTSKYIELRICTLFYYIEIYRFLNAIWYILKYFLVYFAGKSNLEEEKLLLRFIMFTFGEFKLDLFLLLNSVATDTVIEILVILFYFDFYCLSFKVEL